MRRNASSSFPGTIVRVTLTVKTADGWIGQKGFVSLYRSFLWITESHQYTLVSVLVEWVDGQNATFTGEQYNALWRKVITDQKGRR